MQNCFYVNLTVRTESECHCSKASWSFPFWRIPFLRENHGLTRFPQILQRFFQKTSIPSALQNGVHHKLYTCGSNLWICQLYIYSIVLWAPTQDAVKNAIQERNCVVFIQIDQSGRNIQSFWCSHVTTLYTRILVKEFI